MTLSTVSTKPASSTLALFHDESSLSRPSGTCLRPYAERYRRSHEHGEPDTDGDETAWYAEWRALADRIHADADRSAAENHRVSARESYLRASNYYRLCAFYLRVDSSNDPKFAK